MSFVVTLARRDGEFLSCLFDGKHSAVWTLALLASFASIGKQESIVEG